MGFFDFLFNSPQSAPQSNPTPQHRPNHQRKPHRNVPALSSVDSSSLFSSTHCGGNWRNGNAQPAAPEQLNRTVYSKQGNPLTLQESDLITSGGEGLIYRFAPKQNVLIKIYKQKILSNTAKMTQLQERLQVMYELRPSVSRNFAWPCMSVFDQSKNLIGFAMYRCSGKSLLSLCGVSAIRQNFPHWDRSDLVKVAYNLVCRMNELSHLGVTVNDFNPANFLVQPNGEVNFIDCDSYQIFDRKHNKMHLSNTYFPAFVAPELLRDKRLLQQPRRADQVGFGTALLVFYILMAGLHPYSYYDKFSNKLCGSPDQNLLEGRCPLGIGSHCSFPQGNWYNLWSWLIGDLKQSFIETFRDGHQNPQARVSLDQLQKNLQKMYHVMTKVDPQRKNLTPTAPKPRGDRQGKSSNNFPPLN